MWKSCRQFACMCTRRNVLKASAGLMVVPSAALYVIYRRHHVLAAGSVVSWKNPNGFFQRLLSSSSTSRKSPEDVVELIKSGQVQKIVVMAGAGISTPSGIPDFRTPGTGLYDNVQKYNLPYPEAIFDIDYFEVNEKPFFALAKELYPSGQWRPNHVHYFVRLLEEKGLLHRMYTQNIDGLERLAGLSAEYLVEAHGTFATAKCRVCRRKYKDEDIKGIISKLVHRTCPGLVLSRLRYIYMYRTGLLPHEECSDWVLPWILTSGPNPVLLMGKGEILKGEVPRCKQPNCNGIIKPDIVFFGEELPDRFFLYTRDMPQADLLVVMGTSMEVQPFAGIAEAILPGVPRILFNREAAGPFVYYPRDYDVVVKGDLVENICKFCDQLGWRTDLQKLMDAHEELYKKQVVEGKEDGDLK